MELPLTAVLSAMEREGVRVDEAVLAALSEEYEKELARIEGRVYELAGERFTIGSPKQLQVILFEKLKLPVVKKTKTGYSTDESVLEQLAAHHDLPAQVLAYRRLMKLKSTYVDALPPLVDPRTGRIHPIFHQTGAATGRLSSSHPNVQNIPIRTEEGIRIREAFVAAEGHRLVSADYSQVELRILAHFSRDDSLIEAFRAGDDVHRRTAADVAGIEPSQVSPEQRAAAEDINFGISSASPRARPRPPSMPTSRVTKACGASSTRPSPRPAGTASCALCSAAAATCRTWPRATGCCARRPSAWQSTR